MTDNNNFTRKNLENTLVEKLSLSRKDAGAIIDSFFDTIASGLVDNNVVQITNFGSFYLRHKDSRVGLNPKNKKKYIVDARNTISFKISSNLKKKIKDNADSVTNSNYEKVY